MESRAQATVFKHAAPQVLLHGEEAVSSLPFVRGCHHLSFLGTFSWPHLPTPNILDPMDLTAEAEDSFLADDSPYWVGG